MKKNFKKVLLCAFLACQIPSFAQIKVEAEAYKLPDINALVYDGKWTTPRQYYEDGSNADW